MSFDDNETYYVLKEEEDKDDNPLNYAAYSIEETEEELEERDEKSQNSDKKTSPFFLMLKIMFSPVEGWKKLRRSGKSIEKLQSGCFYPLLAILSISIFAEYFYKVNIGLSELVTQAVVSFVAFFFAYFSIPVILSWILSQENSEKFQSKYGRSFTLISLSTLALFSIFTNILPMLWPILIFLPIWTLYIMFKGVRFFQVSKSSETKFYILLSASIIGVPLLIEWLLNFIMPY